MIYEAGVTRQSVPTSQLYASTNGVSIIDIIEKAHFELGNWTSFTINSPKVRELVRKLETKLVAITELLVHVSVVVDFANVHVTEFVVGIGVMQLIEGFEYSM